MAGAERTAPAAAFAWRLRWAGYGLGVGVVAAVLKLGGLAPTPLHPWSGEGLAANLAQLGGMLLLGAGVGFLVGVVLRPRERRG